MGANFCARAYPDGEKELIIERWGSAVEQSLHEDGHSYSGDIGMLGRSVARWYDKDFADREEAYEFLSEEHEKWDPALAVSFIENGDKCWLIGGWCSS